MLKLHLCAIAATFLISGTAQANNDVTFTGSLISSCVLNLSTPGLLSASTDGTTLSSETSGGTSALLAVVAVGTAPTVSFGAPTLNAPAGAASGSTTSIKWTTLSGKNQAFTSNTSSASGLSLIDAFTVNTRVQNSSGFASGNYTVRTTVTCQQ